SCPTLWSVKTRVLRGAPNDSDGLGVIDAGLDVNRAHLIDRGRLPSSPSGSPPDEGWRAIDRDGDGAAAVGITRTSRDSSGRPTYWVDVWARTGAGMTRTTQLNFALCNR